MLLPQAGLRKYAHTALGLIILLAVLVPFLSFLRQGVDWQAAFADVPAGGQAAGQAPGGVADEDARRLKEAGLRLTLDVYRQRVAQAVVLAATAVDGVREAKATVEVNADPNSPRFGTVTAAVVTVVPGERAAPGDVTPVRPVAIGEGGPPPPVPPGEVGLSGEAEGRLREAVATAVAQEVGLHRRQVQVVIDR